MPILIFHNGVPSPVDEVRADLARNRVPERYVEEYLRTAVPFDDDFEQKHPRQHGQFAPKGSSGDSGESSKPASGSGGGSDGGGKPQTSLKEQHQAYRKMLAAQASRQSDEEGSSIKAHVHAAVNKALDAAAEWAKPMVWGAAHLPNIIAGPLALAHYLGGGKIADQTDNMHQMEQKYGRRTANIIHMYGSAIAGMTAGVPAAVGLTHLFGPIVLKVAGHGAAAAGLTAATGGWGPVIMAGMAVGSGVGSALLYTKLGSYAGRLAKHMVESSPDAAESTLKGIGKGLKGVVKGGAVTGKAVLNAARFLFGAGRHKGQEPGLLMTKQGLENTTDKTPEQHAQLTQVNKILTPGKAAMSWASFAASPGSGDKDKDDAIMLPHDEIIKASAALHDHFGTQYLGAVLAQKDEWKKLEGHINDNLHLFADAPKFSLFYNGVPTPEDTVLAELMSVGFAYDDAYVLLGAFDIVA